MKIIIIEDEVLMAKDLAQTLKKLNPKIEIVATLVSVQEAVNFFTKESTAELIFSDIELEDGLSFEIFKQVSINIPVIFCTAYDEYALEAFNTNGVEYILKPFNNASLQKALDKFQWLRDSLHNGLSRQYKVATEALSAYGQKKSATVMVHYRHKILPIPFEKVALIHIENDTVYLHTFRDKSYIIQHTLDEMERIAGADFFRVNRQFLVSRNAVEEASHSLHRKLALTFNFPFHREVLVSKEKSTKFLRWLSE
ncbi:LytR/AlgR family response regulator transcription factor [Elizabethkingia anophelis]|uniref:LytR/AlgR family response regulator transcription factor n=1 Tax=Elizabethkingia anophelis TaxID=1117645 RepID=UPI003891FD8D